MGGQLASFPSVDVFNYFMRSQLWLLNDPALVYLSDYHMCIELSSDEMCDRVFMRFPSTTNEIIEIVS